MRIRLTSLVLILLLGGTTFAGIPLQSGDQSCGMDHAMGAMECCKLALTPAKDADAATARLCCALNCAKEGTAPVNGARFAPQLQLTVVTYPSIPHAILTARLRNPLFGSSHGPPGDSPPAYLRNLTLLI